ncbi:MAG: threonine ammonia-lyase, biosynthetic, partial [Proteobacteria bacterium]|nr:threonine ammonia-lyase, biosynthetic [Pseudomonadota bacterium]
VLEGRSVTEFNYRFSDPKAAQIFLGIRLEEGEDERQQILKLLQDEGYSVIDLTDDEMAKVHIRYMVGGRAHGAADEHIYRFQFPERPGALLQFLNKMKNRWNISLFHYRNHGSDYGRILAGIDVPASETAQLDAHLAALGYAYWEESNNPAYVMFLA